MEKKKFYQTAYFHALVCVLLAALAFLPFLCCDFHSGHDLQYHFGVIRALSVAWDNGNFFGKTMELLGGDYGYGTGLFYSKIPAGICVTLMKTLGVSMIGGIYLELVALFSCSGIVAYFFLRRVFHDRRLAAIGSLAYLGFPYFWGNVYVRFSFTEIFLMLTILMIAWGVYELLYRDNCAAFSALFTVGYALSIFLHFTMTVYVTLFLAVWLIMRWKKVCTKKNLFFFAAATCIVLLIAATYLVPMLTNYSTAQTDGMGRDAKTLLKNSLDALTNLYSLPSFLYVSFIGTLYTVQYFRMPKANRKKDRLTIIVLWGLAVWMYSPLFPWVILPSFMGMIQYPFRVMLIGGILSTVQSVTLLKEKFLTRETEGTAQIAGESLAENGKNKRAACHCGVSRVRSRICWKDIALWGCCAFLLVNYVGMQCSLNRRVVSTTDANVPTAQFSGFSDFYALGSGKNGDYVPKGCTTDYLATRLNDDMIAETDVSVYELSDYGGLSQVAFLADSDGYVVLNLPYKKMEGVALYRFETAYTNRPLAVYATSDDDGAKTKIRFPDYDGESKIILAYQEAPALKEYLQENAFGVLVLEGDVRATNLQKVNVAEYSLEVTATEGGVLELPSLYYKGYKLTLEKADGRCVSVSPVHGRNGFLEADVTESGTLYVEFAGEEFSFAYVTSAVGMVAGAGLLAGAWIWQRKRRDVRQDKGVA